MTLKLGMSINPRTCSPTERWIFTSPLEGSWGPFTEGENHDEPLNLSSPEHHALFCGEKLNRGEPHPRLTSSCPWGIQSKTSRTLHHYLCVVRLFLSIPKSERASDSNWVGMSWSKRPMAPRQEPIWEWRNVKLSGSSPLYDIGILDYPLRSTDGMHG